MARRQTDCDGCHAQVPIHHCKDGGSSVFERRNRETTALEIKNTKRGNELLRVSLPDEVETKLYKQPHSPHVCTCVQCRFLFNPFFVKANWKQKVMKWTEEKIGGEQEEEGERTGKKSESTHAWGQKKKDRERERKRGNRRRKRSTRSEIHGNWPIPSSSVWLSH